MIINKDTLNNGLNLMFGTLDDIIKFINTADNILQLYYNEILVTGVHEIICRAHINRKDSGKQLFPNVTVITKDDVITCVIMDY